MYDEPIISLCYVESRNEKTVRMCRFADYISGEFQAYQYDSTYDFFGTERDIIIGKANEIASEAGSIGVYEWTASQDNTGKWWTFTSESSLPWIEVLTSSCETPEQIVAMIKSGWVPLHFYDKKHDIIICCSKVNYTSQAVYIPANTLVYTGDKLYFSDDTLTLETGNINNDIPVGSCSCRYSKYDNRKYLVRPSSWRSIGTVNTKSSNEIIDAAINVQIRKLKNISLTRKECQTAIQALAKLSEETIIDNVIAQLQCSAKEARNLVSDRIRCLKARLEENDTLWMIEQLINNDSASVQQLRILVEKQWIEAHTSQIQATAKEVERVHVELDRIRADVAAAEAALREADSKRTEYEEQALASMQLRENLEIEIKGRLSAIRENRAKALLEDAWSLPAVSLPSTQPSIKSFAIECETDILDIPESTLSDRMLDAIDTWRVVTGSDERATELATFFFATDAVHQPLLITGECAQMIADTASILTTGRHCTKVRITGDADPSEIVAALKEHPHQYICFVDGLNGCYGIVREVMTHFNRPQIIITTPHAESLAMEPDSLFTTFLPVFTDEFCVTPYVHAPERYNCIKDMCSIVSDIPPQKELKKYKNEHKSWFSNGFFAPLLKERCARLNYAMKSVSSVIPNAGNSVIRSMTTLVFVPLLKSLRCIENIVEGMNSTPALSTDRKEQMLMYIGIEKE